MKPKCLFIMLIFLLATACSPTLTPTPEKIAAQPTAATTNISNTQVFPPTWTPTATLVPTLTPTITITPTITLTPTTFSSRTPIPTRTKNPQHTLLENVKLKLSDLPSGYTEMPLSESEMQSLSMEENSLIPVSWATYIKEDPQISVMSIIAFFDSQESQEEFDRSIEDAAQEMANLGGGFDLSELGIDLEMEVIEDFPRIGDNSTAIRMIVKVEDPTMTMEMTTEIAMFRRGDICAIVMIIDASDMKQAPDLEKLTKLLDSRLVAALKS